MVPDPSTYWISLLCSLPQFPSFKMVVTTRTSQILPQSSRGSPLPVRQTSISYHDALSTFTVFGCPSSLLGKASRRIVHMVLMGLSNLCVPHTYLEEQTGNPA